MLTWYGCNNAFNGSPLQLILVFYRSLFSPRYFLMLCQKQINHPSTNMRCHHDINYQTYANMQTQNLRIQEALTLWMHLYLTSCRFIALQWLPASYLKAYFTASFFFSCIENASTCWQPATHWDTIADTASVSRWCHSGAVHLDARLQ